MSEQAPTKPTKPWYLKWWVWLIGAVLIIGVIGNFAGGGGANEVAAPTPTPTVEPTAPDSEHSPEPEPEVTSEPELEPAADRGPGFLAEIENAKSYLTSDNESYTLLLPITGVRDEHGTIYIEYQLAADDELAVALVRALYGHTSSDVFDGSTIVVDAFGLHKNVYYDVTDDGLAFNFRSTWT